MTISRSEPPAEHDAAEVPLEGASAAAVFAAVLRLSSLRSAFLVGRALAEVCPYEDQWEAVLRDPEFLETLATVHTIVTDVAATAVSQDRFTPDGIADVGAAHYSRGLEAVELLAERLAVDPKDLLAVLITT